MLSLSRPREKCILSIRAKLCSWNIMLPWKPNENRTCKARDGWMRILFPLLNCDSRTNDKIQIQVQ